MMKNCTRKDFLKTSFLGGAALPAEPFVTREDYDIGYWANAMRRYQYRKPFVVPQQV